MKKIITLTINLLIANTKGLLDLGILFWGGLVWVLWVFFFTQSLIRQFSGK